MIFNSKNGLFLFLLLNCFSGFAQNPFPEKISLSTKNGLSHNNVLTIFEDRRGFMWYGTNDGLNRDDGFSVKIYKHNPTVKNSISNNSVRTIYQDKADNIWIGTSSGLNCYTPIYETFSYFFPEENNEQSLSDVNINSIYPFDDENLWIGTTNGLNLFNTKTFIAKRFFKIQGNSNSLSDNLITKIVAASDGIFWIGTINGLNRYDTKSGIFKRFFQNKGKINSISGNNIRSIFIDNNNLIWAATENGLSKIEEINAENFKITNFTPDKDIPHSGNDASIVAPFSENFLFYGLQNTGSLLFNLKTNHFEKYNELSENENKIITAYISKNKILWIGTQDNGITKILLKPKLFKEIHVVDQNKNKPAIYAFCEDNDNIVWTGTTTGLIKYNKSTGFYKYYNIEKNDKRKNTICAIYNFDKNILLIGTNGSGLKIFDKNTGNFSDSKFNSQYPDVDKIYNFTLDKNKNIWLGTNRSSVFEYNPRNEVFKRYDLCKTSTEIKISSILQYRKNEFLITTYNAGLWLLKITDKNYSAEQLKDSDNINSRLSITGGIADSKQIYYFGTVGAGLLKVKNPEQLKFERIRKIPNEDIYSILFDNKEAMWLGSNNGLFKYEPEKDSVFFYKPGDGVQPNEFNAGAAVKCRNGELFFGGLSGFNQFYADSIKENYEHIPLYFTDFKIMNQSVAPGEIVNGKIPISKNILYADKITLSPKDYFFSIEFAGPDFLNGQNLNYRYKLENFDKDWIYTDASKRSAVYTNIPSGNYLFRVQVTDNRGNWQINEATIQIIVEPPFYQKWYFIILFVITGILSIILLIKLRDQALNKEKLILETKLRERTGEIEHTKTELSEEKEFTDSVFIFANDGIIVGDLTGKLLKVNPAFQKMLGYSEAELIGINYEKITPQKWLKSDREELFELRQGISSIKEKEYIRKDGTILPVRMSSAIFENGTKIMAIVTDISKRKVMDKDLENYRVHLENLVEQRTADYKKAKEQAENADRLKSAFLANMSHEIRTPMNAILGFAQLLEYESISQADRLEYIKLINLAGNSLLHLINDIIDLAKIEANQLKIVSEEFSLNNTITEVFASFDKTKHTLDKGNIELILDIPEFSNPTIRADYYRFKQILNNLINNALKFTETGYIRIGYENIIEKGKRFFKFFVEDTGIGIPENEVNQVFERFRKLDENKSRIYGGTGLGLAISKNICDLSGGRIWAKSEYGKGSTFFFTLPDDNIQTKESQQKTSAAKKSIDWKGLKMLVVEDDDNNIFYLKNILKNTGVETLWAKNGKDAYQMFIENKPSIIITDIRMPEMDGIQLCDKIRKQDKNVVIIMQSAYSQAEDIKKAQEAGSNDYISKPYKKSDLIELIDKYLIDFRECFMPV
jgi:PAS domain S-box-containing protein